MTTHAADEFFDGLTEEQWDELRADQPDIDPAEWDAAFPPLPPPADQPDPAEVPF